MLLTRKRRSRGRGGQRARPRTRSRAPAPKPKPRRSPRDVVAGLEQHHLDLIGLGLIAVAVYLGCVLYVGWDGGPVGDSLSSALADATGRVAYIVPIAVAGWGVALLLRPIMKARPRSTPEQSCCLRRCCSRLRPRPPLLGHRIRRGTATSTSPSTRYMAVSSARACTGQRPLCFTGSERRSLPCSSSCRASC